MARRQPDAPALIHGDRTDSYSAIYRMAVDMAGKLGGMGLSPGARCLFWAANSAELAAAILGAWRLGAVIALVNDEAPLTHFVHAADRTRPVLAVVQNEKAETARTSLGIPVVTLGEAAGSSPVRLPQSFVHDQEPASIFFTSGSTGLPKGVVQSHATLMAGCQMVAGHLGFAASDRILCPIPWSFDYGYGQLLSTMLLGIPQILPEARNPISICEAISRHRPTILAGLPSIFALLIRGISPIRETDLSSLRLITNTGGKIAPAIFDDLLDLFSHCDISLNYGMTETYRGAALPVGLVRERPDSIGFAYPGVSINILRPDASEAAPGEEGEIVHRGIGVFLGYWGDAEATAKTRRPDPLWTHDGVPPPMAVFSGDLGWKDQAGFLYVKGRRDRLIKSMGVRVSPDEVETLFRKSGLVRDVAVVGVPHELMGEMVCCAVSLDGIDADRKRIETVRGLKAFARKEMSNFMQPRDYRIVADFPLTPNGKPDLAGVRALFTGALQ